MLMPGQLGVHPPGALGVAFFVHAQAESLVGRHGDGITEHLKDAGCLCLEEEGEQRVVPLGGRIFANLLEADVKDALPELLLVCCNPAQLDGFTGEMTRFLESLAERGRLSSPLAVRRGMPILLILPNGVLFESTVKGFREQINESQLMGRLPGVTPEVQAAIADRVVRESPSRPAAAGAAVGTRSTCSSARATFSSPAGARTNASASPRSSPSTATRSSMSRASRPRGSSSTRR